MILLSDKQLLRDQCKRLAISSGLFCVVLLLVSCQSTKYESGVGKSMDDTVATVEHESGAKPKLPDNLSDLLLPSLADDKEQVVVKREEKFDISVTNIAARDFFLGLVDGSNRNIVIHPEVTGDITLELKDVTIAEVLQVTRDLYGYEYKFEDGIYTIYPHQMRTEIFQINYLNVRRVGMSDTSVLIGEINTKDNQNGSSSSSGNSGGSSESSTGLATGLLNGLNDSDQPGNNSSETSGSQISTAGPGSRIQTTVETDFWFGLRRTILAIIGGGGGEKLVVVTPQAGLVVVRALPKELSAIRDYLEKSELSVKRQVILEAKILEVELSDGYQTGINWTSIGGHIKTYKNVSASTGTTETFADGIDGPGEVFTSVVGVDDITSLLNLLKSQGNVKVLSSPRISTVNNQKAIIRVGSDQFFVTGFSSGQESTNASATVTSTPDVELSSFFSGIALDVTPQIAEDGEIIIHVHPVISNVSDQNKELTLGDKQFSLPLAVRDIRESDSIVKARNGQVIVLGGLMQERVAEYKGIRPLLSDIPILGHLFDSEMNSSKKTELVILLQPRLANDKAWYQSVQKSKEVFKELGI